MKTALIIAGLVVLTGCSNAPQLDSEYGKAYRQSQDRQVAYPGAPFAKPVPEGMEGITAEEVMKAHNKTYTEKPTETEKLNIGILGGMSSN